MKGIGRKSHFLATITSLDKRKPLDANHLSLVTKHLPPLVTNRTMKASKLKIGLTVEEAACMTEMLPPSG